GGEPSGEKAPDGRPFIRLTAEEHLVIQQVTDALASDDWLYQRDGVIISPRLPEPEAEPPPKARRGLRVRRPAGMPALTPAKPALVRHRIAARCRLVRLNEDREMVRAHPPEWLVKGVQAVPGRIRSIQGLLQGPTLAPDGRLINVPGYDGGTGLFLARDLP